MPVQKERRTSSKRIVFSPNHNSFPEKCAPLHRRGALEVTVQLRGQPCQRTGGPHRGVGGPAAAAACERGFVSAVKKAGSVQKPCWVLLEVAASRPSAHLPAFVRALHCIAERVPLRARMEWHGSKAEFSSASNEIVK